MRSGALRARIGSRPEGLPLVSPSVGALLRVALKRARADWAIVLAAFLIVLTSTALVSAAAIYARSVSVASLHRLLGDAPVATSHVEVTVRVPAARYADADLAVRRSVARALGPANGDLDRSGESTSFVIRPSSGAGDPADLAVLGFAEGIESHATLSAGGWPFEVVPEGAPAVPVAIPEGAATSLGLAVGDELALTSTLDPTDVVHVQVVGVFRVADVGDAFWWGDRQVLDGSVGSEDFVTYGPFLTTRADFTAYATERDAQYLWRATPRFANLSPDGIDAVRHGVEALRGSVQGALGASAGTTVSTGLPDLLAAASQSLLVSRTGILLLAVQLAVLAAYATLLSAGLLVEHRRFDTAMLRARGSGRANVASLAAIEGLAMVGLAVAVAPWIASWALRLLDVSGPLAEVGLSLDPTVAADAYLAAALAGVLCFVALLVPTALATRSFAAVDASISRAETRDIGRRLGLDVALLAVAAIGLLQLRQYGAPLTKTIRGALGLDPLLVAAPAIGLLAGAVVALRLIPLAARAIEVFTGRGRGLVASLGSRQLARRPLRYTRSVLLLTLAMAMGVFAVSYGATWTSSQADQARFQLGADVRVEPGRQVAALPEWALASAYGALPGVDGATAVSRDPLSIGPVTGGQLVGVDAAQAARLVRVRGDLTERPIGEVLQEMSADRPVVAGIGLPDGTTALRLRVTTALQGSSATGEDLDPSVLERWRGMRLSVVVRDAGSLLHTFAAQPASLASGSRLLDVTLVPGDATGRPTLAYPVEIVAIQVFLAGPDLPGSYVGTTVTGNLAVQGVDALVGARQQAVPLTLAGGWRIRSSLYGGPQQSVPAAGGGLSVATGVGGFRVIPPIDQAYRGVVLTFAPGSLTALASHATPVVATEPFLTAAGARVGDELAVAIGGVARSIHIAGVARAFPTVDPEVPTVVIDLPTLSLLRLEGGASTDPGDEWWLGVAPGRRTAVVAALEAPPFLSASAVSIDQRTRALTTDPVALGIIGALVIGAAAAALFAIVGFTVSTAVTARERIGEFALLRALGLSIEQLSAWLALESVALAAISLAAGTALGLVMAWVALPFVTVTQEAVAPFPPVLVRVPWNTVALIAGVGIVALVATVLVLIRVLRRIGLASALRIGED